jgi:hypothetical protein
VDETPLKVPEVPVEVRRQMNDDRRRRFGQEGRVIALLCECSDPTCLLTVLLPADEYDAIRPEIILADAHASTAPIQH